MAKTKKQPQPTRSPQPASEADSALPRALPLFPGEDIPRQGPEDDALRSMAVRRGFDPLAAFPQAWAERFLTLEKRYRWELAALIVWLSLPKNGRQPPTLEKLAREIFHLSPRRLRDLRNKHPEIEEEVKTTRRLAVYNIVPDVFAALGQLACKADFHNIPAIKLVLEMSGDYTPKQEHLLGVPDWVKQKSATLIQQQQQPLADLAAIPEDDDLPWDPDYDDDAPEDNHADPA